MWPSWWPTFSMPAARCSASTRRRGCSRWPSRRAAEGAENVEFLQADARAFKASEPFDAIVARLLLFHLPDREEVLRRQLDALRPGGTMVVIEFDIGAMRGEPEVPLVEAVRRWIEAAFRAAGADPRIGAQTGQMLRRTGFADVSTLGIQAYFAPSDPIGPLLCASVTRSLAPQIVAHGIADEAELGLETLQERIAEQVVARDAVILPPTVVGAWGARPSDLGRLRATATRLRRAWVRRPSGDQRVRPSRGDQHGRASHHRQ